MLKKIVKISLGASAAVASSIIYMKNQNRDLKIGNDWSINFVKRGDLNQKDEKKEKSIVVIGSGIIGLTTAYYLSKNPLNKITIIERNELPYRETSFQNGCYFHTQGCESWINKPFSLFLQGIYKKNHTSKVYLSSMLQDPLTIAKFGYIWLFQQPDKDTFAKTILTLFEGTQKLLENYIQELNIQNEDLGYRPDSKIIILQKNQNFDDFKRQIDFVKNPHVYINRNQDNEKMAEIENQFPHVPAIKRYSDVLIRKNPTLNTAKVCESLYQHLSKKQNVKFFFDSYVSGYTEVEQKGLKKNKLKKIKSVMINYDRKQIEGDIFILCNGPQARKHIREHLQTILPMISAQGYSIDLPDINRSIDKNVHLKIGDRGYAYTELEPGKHRIVALMDFGCHDEAFIDKERIDHLISMYQQDFQFVPANENDVNVKNIRSCLRPQSPDDMPIVGAMSNFQNIYLNLGHGGHGTSLSFATAQIVHDLVEKVENPFFKEDIIQMVDTQRLYI